MCNNNRFYDEVLINRSRIVVCQKGRPARASWGESSSLYWIIPHLPENLENLASGLHFVKCSKTDVFIISVPFSKSMIFARARVGPTRASWEPLSFYGIIRYRIIRYPFQNLEHYASENCAKRRRVLSEAKGQCVKESLLAS